MASNIYLLNFNNPSKTALDLTFVSFKKVSDGSSLTAPDIEELDNGFYKFSYDLDTSDSDIYYVVSDGGSNILTGSLSKAGNEILNNLLLRILGLSRENQFLDTPVYDLNGNLTSCRIRTYSDTDSVGTIDNVLASYDIQSTYIGNQLQTFAMKRA